MGECRNSVRLSVTFCVCVPRFSVKYCEVRSSVSKGGSVWLRHRQPCKRQGLYDAQQGLSYDMKLSCTCIFAELQKSFAVPLWNMHGLATMAWQGCSSRADGWDMLMHVDSGNACHAVRLAQSKDKRIGDADKVDGDQPADGDMREL